MAEFWVRHSLNPNKAVKFNITLRYFVAAGEKGEHIWVLEIGTTYPDADGKAIVAKKVHLISAEDLDEIIEESLADLCAQIDWSPFVADKYAPSLIDVSPTGSGISIWSNVEFTITDKLPSAGIDLSNMKVILNNSMTDFDITSECRIEGDPYQYEFVWGPQIRVYGRYS